MMDKAFFELNPIRSVIAIGGEDRQEFLQGLISNDTRLISEERAIYAALLTPQGKFAYDLFLVGSKARYLVDAESARRAELLKRLKLFRLRSQVALEDLDEALAVANVFGGDSLQRLGLHAEAGNAAALAGGVVFTDPRLPALGARAFLPRAEAERILSGLGFAPAAPGTFQKLRFSLGVPESSSDLLPDKSILLESGFDELHGVDWQKGCYMGQELTARTKYRGLVRKRLLPVKIEGAAPAPGTILTIDGKEAGEIRIASADGGLALIRLEYLEAMTSKGTAIDGAYVTALLPAWVKLPEMV